MTDESLFAAALEYPSAAARRAFLDEACAGNPAQRRRLDDLLAGHDQATGILDRSANQPGPAENVSPPVERTGAVLAGRYRLIEEVGAGGMGSVWAAEQTGPVRRTVAVKLVKAGMDSRLVLARFEAERQALALMDHPYIARVIDGGFTPDGRPFFAMELVDGVPITDFCDRHHLTPRQRLGLFADVCRAVQHAHQKGVIHRDLKPSNVLVSRHDTTPVVKVIDFGIAKAVGQALTDKTLITGPGQLVGTPLYMSPEQAGMGDLDVDTRSDVYSLGVLLYELLTGTTPFPKERFRQAAYDEIRRIIREEEPPRPSSRLTESKDALPSVAAQRHTEPAKLTRLVRGELDWIVMKALEKDRNRRYESAGAFAVDVDRYLRDEPVQACPPSVGYRLRKAARRHRGPVLAASLVVLALVAGVVGTAVGLARAEHRAEGERRAKETAEKRLIQIENGIDLLSSLFADLDPFAEEKDGRPLRAILGDRLDRAAADLEGEAVGDPLVVARLQDRLGQSCLGLGHAARAESLFARAVETRQAHLGADDPATLASRHHQARAYEAAGKRNEAVKQFEQVWSARARVLSPDHPDTLSTLHELAVAYRRSGKPAEAIPLLQQVRDGRVRHLGEGHDDTLATLQALADAYSAAKRHPEAIALAEQVRDVRVKKYGDGHPYAINAMANLAGVYVAGYKMRPALALFEQARDRTVPKLGPYHPQTLRILYGLGQMYRAFRKTPEAIALLEQVRERDLMVFGGHHPATLNTLFDLAMAYVDAGESGKALPLFQQAAVGVERLDYAFQAADRLVNELARCHEQLNQYDQAEVWRRKWLAEVRAKDGPTSLNYAGVRGLMGLGANLLEQKKYADAEPVLRESLAILEKGEPGVWGTFRAQSLYGAALLGRQKYAEAEPYLLQGYRGMKAKEKGQGTRYYGRSPRQLVTEALERLVELYDAWGKPAEAAKWRMEFDALNQAAATP